MMPVIYPAVSVEEGWTKWLKTRTLVALFKNGHIYSCINLGGLQHTASDAHRHLIQWTSSQENLCNFAFVGLLSAEVCGLLGTKPRKQRASKQSSICVCMGPQWKHPPAPNPWKNCLLWNWSLVLEKLGTAGLMAAGSWLREMATEKSKECN